MLRSLALLLVCLAPAVAQETTPLRFDWPVPSRATVTQKGLKKGRTVTMRYRIELSREGEELRLGVSEVTLLEAEGMDLSGPAEQAAVAAQAAQLQIAFPVLRIATSGELLGVDDWEGHVNRCCELLTAVSKGADRAGVEQTRQMMLDPAYRSMLEAKSGEHWQVWVGAWLGAELEAGETQEGAMAIPLGEEAVEAAVTLEHQGLTPEGVAQLRMTTLLEGPEAEAAFRRLMLDMTRRGPRPLPEDFRLDAFSKRTLLEVTLDPRSMRPTRASSDMQDRITIEGEAREQVERRSYTFAWDE